MDNWSHPFYLVPLFTMCERLLQIHTLIGQEVKLSSCCPIRATELYLLSNQNTCLYIPSTPNPWWSIWGLYPLTPAPISSCSFQPSAVSSQFSTSTLHAVFKFYCNFVKLLNIIISREISLKMSIPSAELVYTSFGQISSRTVFKQNSAWTWVG